MIRSYESEEWKSGSTDSFWVFKRLKQKIGESEKQKHFTQQLDGKYAGFFFGKVGGHALGALKFPH